MAQVGILWGRKRSQNYLGFDTSQGKDQWFYWTWSIMLRLAIYCTRWCRRNYCANILGFQELLFKSNNLV